MPQHRGSVNVKVLLTAHMFQVKMWINPFLNRYPAYSSGPPIQYHPPWL